MGCTLPKQEQEERVKLLGDGLKKCSSHPTLLPDESFILSISEFNKDSKEFGGLSIRCRACSAIMRCLDKDIDIIRARHANLHHKHKLINDGYKYCPRCHETKPVSDFYTVRTKHPKKGRYHSYCKQCEVRYRAKWASGPLNRVRVRKSVRSNRNANPN